MLSVYWVLSWACHRKCPYCYDDRFRLYVRDSLRAVVGEDRQPGRKSLGYVLRERRNARLAAAR